MALALCLTLLPATALAADAEPHKHCLCGTEHTGIGDHKEITEITFDKWLASNQSGDSLEFGTPGKTSGTALKKDDDNKWILPAGTYYLEKIDNHNADGAKTYCPIKIQGDVTICLNGKQIQKVGSDIGPVFEVTSGTLTLTDCNGHGKVTHSASSDSGSGVYVGAGGTLNLYGGIITGNKGQKGTNNDRYGGGVYVEAGGTFNMYGGTFTKNDADYGGGVYVSDTKSTFTMNKSASITGNGASYGGVYASAGTFAMNDSSKVTDNAGGLHRVR